MASSFSPAPGAPGVSARWTSSAKSGIGKAINAASDLAFSISHGILNEIYYPHEDTPCTRDMGFLVSDGKNFFSEEKRHASHITTTVDDGIPAFRIETTGKKNSYRLTKEIVTDPLRNTLLQKVHFRSNNGTAYHLYALLAPHLNNQGDHNSGWTGSYKGIPMLFATGKGLALAMACSTGWGKRSAGFVGISDGWTDIHAHGQMTWEYSTAPDGNIALTGEIAVPESGDFLLAIGFGRNWEDAANHAWGSILDGFDSAKERYMEGWVRWYKTLQTSKGRYFKTSAAVLRISEAKAFPGAVLASLSIPWGAAKGDKDKGGYHLVWPRDLVETAGGFIALGTKDDALRIVNYLLSTQKEDGSWPQNMWLPGTSYWQGHQKDQAALPILLLAKCYEYQVFDAERMTRYWPMVKKALHYLLVTGPYTEQDRWEEEKGFSPFTLAAVISGLLAGADIADFNKDLQLAEYCRETADAWNDRIEEWTYAGNTALAQRHDVRGYYIRINPYPDVSAEDLGDRTIDLKNHSGDDGRMLLNELISVDALALVRFGLREPDDPRILDTIKVIDSKLKIDTPGGPCWHRYNNDGYGEHTDGEAFDGTGIGRAWPLLTGERAHYEIARGRFEEAERLLQAMDTFANEGLLPEQIWDSTDIPGKGLFFGKHSGSGMPLTWAHAEYIKLCVSLRDKAVFDMPRQTAERYLREKKVSSYKVWRFGMPFFTMPPDKVLRIEVMAEAVIHWTDDKWETVWETMAVDRGMGVYIADLASDKAETELVFTFFWKRAQRWEGRNFSVIREPHQR